jgi:hypothetical protein
MSVRFLRSEAEGEDCIAHIQSPETIDTETFVRHFLSAYTVADLESGTITYHPGSAVYAKAVNDAIRLIKQDGHRERLQAKFTQAAEVDMYYELRKNETSALSAYIFDKVLAEHSGKSIGIDLMWALSFYNSSKGSAIEAINELRGKSSSFGGGMLCDKCGKKSSIIQPVQLRSGDEPTQIKIICMEPSCGHSAIIG